MPRSFGQLTTAAATEVPLEATTYTEQTTNALRSLVSGSAQDGVAGTGALTVRITYFTLAADGTIAGPFQEVVVMNGVTAVPTVNRMALIERMEVASAGSGLAAAGVISMKAVSDGSGATVGSIAASAVRTLWAHHYVPTGKQCLVQDLTAIGGDAAAALLQLKVQSYPTAGVPEQPMTEKVGTTLTFPRALPMSADAPGPVAGPARIRLTVTPANTNSQVTYAGFGWAERAG